MQNLQKASEIVRDGGIIIFPTDTAFGIGCRIDSPAAVEKLFTIRRRSTHKATPVLVGSIEMAEMWVDGIPNAVRELMDHYWPGGLTIVLPSTKQEIPPLVKGGTDTLGVRMPNHLDVLSLINTVGVPLIGSSANFEGENTPYEFQDLNPELVKLVDYVLPGECTTKQASTVVDCTTEPYTILREGAVQLTEL